MFGNFNWATRYGDLLTDGWETTAAIPTTLEGSAAPTRCLTRNVEMVGAAVVPVLGVPHHAAVFYDCIATLAPQRSDEERLARAAEYRWTSQPTTD